MKKILCIITALLGLIGGFAQNYQGIIYVTPTGAGTHSGDSWANATSSIDTAQTLAQTHNVTTVWVATGIYYGDTTTTFNPLIAFTAFSMVEGVNVYGGFAGNESSDYDLSQRDFETNETILDGMNVKRVLQQLSDFNTETTWDGFTIQNGQTIAGGAGVWLAGQGRLSHCLVQNNTCTSSNTGGGGGIYATNSSIVDCQITGNTASYLVGGVYASGSVISRCQIDNNIRGGICSYSTVISHCKIHNNKNTASNYGGGDNGTGISGNQNTIIDNCLISNNDGTGVYLLDGSSSINNSTIVRNNRGVYVFDSGANIDNCIIWGNATNLEINSLSAATFHCAYSAIENGWTGDGNIVLSEFAPYTPLFVKPSLSVGASDTTSDVNWHLQEGSICINRGTSTAALDSLDLGGTLRVKHDTVDMGCYESDFHAITLSNNYGGIIYVTPTGAGTHSGDSWINATSSIAFAQVLAKTYSADVWVAGGIYYGDTNSTSENAFVAIDGVNVYGGFAGNEPANYNLDLRNFEVNESILDGGNSHRVLYHYSRSNLGIVWDGFTICNGNTTGTGGGVDLDAWYVADTIRKCKIYNNISSDCGGGVCAIGNYGAGAAISVAVISNCKVYNNTARWGGGVFCACAKVMNSLIANNSATACGGGLFSQRYDTIINSTIVRNEAPCGGGLYASSYSLDFSFVNCIVWGNETDGVPDNNIEDISSCRYSAIEGGYVGEGNVSLLDFPPYTPLFVNPSLTAGSDDTTSNVDWHLQQGSICVNRGTNTAVSEFTDLDGNLRIQLDTVDMGCYESNCYSQVLPAFGDKIYVTSNGAGNKTGENWENAMSSITTAQAIALMNDADVWVAAGTYFGDSLEYGAFYMKGVNVYGGFYGNEPTNYDLSLRDFESNTSILDGQHERRVVYQTNSFPAEASFDGFTIQNGYTSGNGGGVFLMKNGKLNNCEIRNNEASYQGGGVLVNLLSTITNCNIHDNNADYGGGAYAWNSSNIYNCAISNNTASGDAGQGGGIYARMNSNIVNSTVVKNNANIGGGIYSQGSSNRIHNSVIWGNENDVAIDNIANAIVCSYSAIEGSYEGDHNIDVSETELFVNPSQTAGIYDNTPNVDWHLLPNAICINKGLNDSIVGNVDLAGLPRINCDTVDMGCYEYYPIVESFDTANNSYLWHNTTYTTSGDYYWMNPVLTGCDSIHVLHLNITVGVDDYDGFDFKVYPNPTSNIVNVECIMKNEEWDGMELHLCDAYGRLLDVVRANNDSPLQTAQIDLSRYAKGVYFIKAVADGETIAVRKVVKQ